MRRSAVLASAVVALLVGGCGSFAAPKERPPAAAESSASAHSSGRSSASASARSSASASASASSSVTAESHTAPAVRPAELPGGGRTLFPGRMLVALYGNPGSAALGVLGEQGIDASIERARAQAAAYKNLVSVPVVPAFEIIATVASSAPGPDGNYSAESAPEDLKPWVEAAGRAGIYVILDLQPGRTDFLHQALRYRSLLEQPNVGLALDPEWRLGPNQQHLQSIGSVGIDEVNGVVSWLARLTRDKELPQKLLILHQFRLSMITGRERLDVSRPQLAVMIHADGQGAWADKQDTWRAIRQGAPHVHWGWKNFIDEDKPMLTPQQTIAWVDPRPELITYQ